MIRDSTISRATTTSYSKPPKRIITANHELFTSEIAGDTQIENELSRKKCCCQIKNEIPQSTYMYINILKNANSTEESKIKAAEDLKDYVIDNRCQAIITSSNFISSLTQMLADTNIEICRHTAAIILADLALDETARINIGKNSTALSSFIAMLVTDNSEKCKITAAIAIGYLALYKSNMEKIIANNLVIPKLIDMLNSDHKAYKKNAAISLGILGSYSNNVSRISGEKYKIVSQLIDMLLNSSSKNSIKNAAISLGYLATSTTLNITKMLENPGVISQLIIMRYIEDPSDSFKNAAEFALTKIIPNDSLRNQVYKQPHIIMYLVNLLDSDSKMLYNDTIKCIGLFTKYDEGFKVNIVKAGVFSKLLGILKKSNPTAIFLALEIINNLTEDVIPIPYIDLRLGNQNLQFITNADTIRHFIYLFEFFNESRITVIKIIIKILKLGVPEYKDDIVNAGAIPKFINMLAPNNASNELIELVAELIYWLAFNCEKFQTKLCETDIINRLLKLLNSTEISYSCKNRAVIAILSLNMVNLSSVDIRKIIEALKPLTLNQSIILDKPLIDRAIKHFNLNLQSL